MMKTIFKKIVAFILKLESQLVLFKYQPRIIAITGSFGKTSTKDAVFTVLSKTAHVRKSEKSYNSEIGLPLTILGCANAWNNPFLWLLNILKGFWLFIWPHQYPEWLVLEVGIGKPGDMERTASWIKTDAVIITAIGETPTHIEFFDSRKHLVEEKGKLMKTLKKEGLLVLNADDEDVAHMKTKSKNRSITYGFKTGADLTGSGEIIAYNDENIPEGIMFRVDEAGSSLPVVLEGVFGKNHTYAALAALALVSGLKLNMIMAVNSLKNSEFPPGRMRLLKGIKNTLIIDDTYNSSPFACEVAIKTLGEIKNTGRKIAILGDMLELGKHTTEAHKNIGKITKNNTDLLITVGLRAKMIKEGAIEAGLKNENIFEFQNAHEAGNFLENFLQDKDFVLVKGSQGMRMERIVEKIILDKENKEKLLVRQDEEWKKRK